MPVPFQDAKQATDHCLYLGGVGVPFWSYFWTPMYHEGKGQLAEKDQMNTESVDPYRLGHSTPIHPRLVHAIGRKNPCILLAYLISIPEKRDGWIKGLSAGIILSDTSLKLTEQRTAREILRSLGLVEERRKPFDNTEFKINKAALRLMMDEYCESEGVREEVPAL